MKDTIMALVIAVLLIACSSIATNYFKAKDEISKIKTEHNKEIESIKIEHNNEIEKINKQRTIDNQSQKELSTKIDSIRSKQNEMQTKLTEISKRPVYSSLCIDNDGLFEINKIGDATKTP
ncbi:hypothetical protein [Dickeya phage Sucellus]|nr:hypothetical protein [Dickeya phage Sucellus]